MFKQFVFTFILLYIVHKCLRSLHILTACIFLYFCCMFNQFVFPLFLLYVKVVYISKQFVFLLFRLYVQFKQLTVFNNLSIHFIIILYLSSLIFLYFVNHFAFSNFVIILSEVKAWGFSLVINVREKENCNTLLYTSISTNYL